MQRRATTTTVSPQRSADDRLQRALHENSALKLQKSELEEKLRKVQTQFRRLATDWRQAQEHGASASASAVLPSFTLVSSPLAGAATTSASTPSVRPHSSAEPLRGPSEAASPPSVRGVLPALNPNVRPRASATPSASPLKSPVASAPSLHTAGTGSEAELAACRAALAHAQLELQQVRAAAAAAAQSRMASPMAAAASPLSAAAASAAASPNFSAAALAAAQSEAAALRAELQQVREELHTALLAKQQLEAQSSSTMHGLQQQLQGIGTAQQQLETQYKAAIDALTREKQELTLKLRLMEVDKQAATSAASAAPAPTELATLQGEVHRKASEVTQLHSRLQYAQGQVETLKGECGRLIEELKQAHTAHADTKKALFALEHDAATLRTRCDSFGDMELALQRKTEENTKLEQELLKLVGSLQTCNRETEAAVRLEYQSRLAEVQEMRDAAERERREVERRLLHSQHDVADLRRRLESAQADAQLYRGEAAKAEKEQSVLSAQIAFAGHTAAAAAAAGGAELTDDDVHRALAVAAIRKRGGRMSAAGAAAAAGGGAGGADEGDGAKERKEAGDALDLFEALHWDGDWEQGQLREALAAAAMDLELAETRCQQLSEQAEQSREALRRLGEERDVLLEESIALRGRIAHVQTIFAKQQLQAYRTATATGGAGDGLIAFAIHGLQSRAQAMCRAMCIPDLSAPVSFFFTLEGLDGYEAMVGPTLHALDDVVDVRFHYNELTKDSVTLAAIEQTTFCFQLHCVAGEGSRLVAMAELPGTALLSAREAPVADTLDLVDGEGQTVGTIAVEFCCARLVLPIVLGNPLPSPRAGMQDAFTLSAGQVKSAMVALRAVRYLRVQVFSAKGLAGLATAGSSGSAGGTAPQPYVFYTATSPVGALSCVRDTVVHPSSRAFTTDPVFDAAPVDHRVVVDPSLVRFVAFGVVNFVLFDERAADVQRNLGVAAVTLRPLLESPYATIRVTEPLHPQGSLTLGLSWVCGA